MNRALLSLLIGLLVTFQATSQTSGFQKLEAEQVLLGQYNPADYAQQFPVTTPATIFQGIQSNLSSDSLKSYLERLDDFGTRNTGSDTTSLTTGIGAARNWILSKFEQFSAANENRLVTSHFYFNRVICSMTKHKNVVAILPGTDTLNKELIIIEGHYDSRCENVCDTGCVAHGMEDNGSGTALVMELARVMSAYSYPQTIVFMATTAEEQGLWGANDFAYYLQQSGIETEAVLNNDVIGGIICGQTASPPGCPGKDDIDSTQVRLFSYGGFNSINKMLARYVKMEYTDEILPYTNVPMQLSLMSAEDRTGRGGDHIPFRKRGVPAIRFTSANEHGDAGVGSGYTDRQHTTDDILGVDTDGDNVLDSFYVDFNYLKRNAITNGVAAAALALGPEQPDFVVNPLWNGELEIVVTDTNNIGNYLLGVRSTALDFDTLIPFTGNTFVSGLGGGGGDVFLSVCAQDANGIESLFDEEIAIYGLSSEEQALETPKTIELLPNYPNPFDDATIISFKARLQDQGKKALIRITDLKGAVLQDLPIDVQSGLNEVEYHHGYGMSGTYLYSLIVEGEVIDTRRMVFAN
jgi:hypothetical protein